MTYLNFGWIVYLSLSILVKSSTKKSSVFKLEIILKNDNFLESGVSGLLKTFLDHNSPLYVQYYITARCNLRCQQCNVIYANSDVPEASTEKTVKAIENLGKIGTNVILFTGCEPFVRSDLPILVKKAIENGMHPRIQTNGLASVKALEECVESGVRDISISLDSLVEPEQDFLNGEFENSWETAINTISNVTNIFPKDSFCALGCVFSPKNFQNVRNVIRFADQIGWWVSLVPAHSTSPTEPRSFSTFDRAMLFDKGNIDSALKELDLIIAMKKNGSNVYDSYEYLENVKLFIQQKPIKWRRKNENVCDSPNLYFAVLPDASLAPCCDWRLSEMIDVSNFDFPEKYKSKSVSKVVLPLVKSCSGCMYGSYPEISISARFISAALERFTEFVSGTRPSIEPKTTKELKMIIEKISTSGS
jgi:organic radical activating enzyme